MMDSDDFEDHLELLDPEVNRTLADSAAEDRAGKGRPLAAFIDALADEDTDNPS